jgi:hypothetical protein
LEAARHEVVTHARVLEHVVDRSDETESKSEREHRKLAPRLEQDRPEQGVSGQLDRLDRLTRRLEELGDEDERGEGCDEVEHDRRNDLVGLGVGLERAGDRAIDPAAERTGEQTERNQYH